VSWQWKPWRDSLTSSGTGTSWHLAARLPRAKVIATDIDPRYFQTSALSLWHFQHEDSAYRMPFILPIKRSFS
jgi:hypothetical protein